MVVVMVVVGMVYEYGEMVRRKDKTKKIWGKRNIYIKIFT